MAFLNPACAAVNLIGTVANGRYTGSTYIAWIPLGQAVILANYVIQYVNGTALPAGSSVPWFNTVPAPYTIRITTEVDPSDLTLKQRLWLDWDIDLSLVNALTDEFQLGGTVNGVAFTHCVIMPGVSVGGQGYPNLVRFTTSGSGGQTNINAWTKADAGDLGLIHTTASSYQSTRCGAPWVNGNKILFNAWDGTNASNILSIDPGGGGEVNEVNATEGIGAPIEDLWMNQETDIMYAPRSNRITVMDFSGGSGSAVLGTAITGVTSVDSAITGDPSGGKLYYGSSKTTPTIRSCNFDGSGEVEVCSNAQLNAVLTSNKSIEGMAFNENNGLIYCLNDAGELFHVDPADGTVTLLLNNTQWDQVANANSFWWNLEIDLNDGDLWVVDAASGASSRYAWKVPIGNETSNTREFQVASGASSSVVVFCLSPGTT